MIVLENDHADLGFFFVGCGSEVKRLKQKNSRLYP